MENSDLRIPQAPPARATGNIGGKIRANARSPRRAQQRTTQSLTLAARAPSFFPAAVRESAAPVHVAPITRMHSCVHEQHGKRTTRVYVDNAIGSAKPTLRLRGSSRRHGVIRENKKERHHESICCVHCFVLVRFSLVVELGCRITRRHR